MDDLTFRHQAVDHPGWVPWPHCAKTAPLPADEPWLIVDGVPRQPHLESFRCPHCRGRIYLQPVTDEEKTWDADHDAIEDEDT